MNNTVTCRMSDRGIEAAVFHRGGKVSETVEFRSDGFAGPSLYITDPGNREQRIKMIRHPAGFSGNQDGLAAALKITDESGALKLSISLHNASGRAKSIKRFSLRTGIDCYMESYPEWNEKYFPTLLRCEKTHFWGYAMTPRGKILGISSPDPVASWRLDYESEATDNPECDGRAGLHRIFTFCLDLLHAAPLPERHPAAVDELAPGFRAEWTLYLYPLDEQAAVKPAAAHYCGAPMPDSKRYSVPIHAAVQIDIVGGAPRHARLIDPDGIITALPGGTEHYEIALPDAGQYRFQVENNNGKTGECTLAALRPWSWYLKKARCAADFHKQYASSHLEQWLGLHSAFLARKHFPEAELDARLMRRFEEIFDAMWDRRKKRSRPETFGRHNYRVFSNTAQMVSLLTDLYQAGAGIEWLETAAGLADEVITWQHKDGYYAVPDCLDQRNDIVYTTVFYPAKSILELCAAEKLLAGKNHLWRERYDRHFSSARKAVAHLERSRDNLNTEGQDSFEDGMISCSATQLGLYALTVDDPEEQKQFAATAEAMMEAHACLEQRLIPDARMSCGTLRFWEAQYDVLARKAVNMMNSPHGWSAWSLYGVYYLYLLTGREKWLFHLLNGMGACMQLLDPESGELRWSFICDPYIEAALLKPDEEYPGRGKRHETVIGEQYLPMIAAFHYPADEPVLGNSPENGWSCCNDVHETIKCLEETILTNAFVIEGSNGEIEGYNCSAYIDRDGLKVEASEACVANIHLNLRKKHAVTVFFSDGTQQENSCFEGRGWIRH